MAQRRAVTSDQKPNIVDRTTNERILWDAHGLYSDRTNGLIAIGKLVGLNLLAPRRKIVVMLIGNHSAGKSSFINWYIEENVQKTGVAIETQGFTFITSGKKRETLSGEATLHLYPHFKSMEDVHGVINYLGTEISTSRKKKFGVVTFIDTPGLVDGEMFYPYDVDKAIVWLGNLADRILVFFDPIGQALCKKTLNLVQELSVKHSNIIRFYLSKADEAGCESDRQKVMMQIVQEICKRPGLNKCGFNMPTVYIPDEKIIRATTCVNQIEGICDEIEKAINYTVQNTINTLDKDCDRVIKAINKKLEDDAGKRKANLKANLKSLSFVLMAMLFPVLLLLKGQSGDPSPWIANALGSNSTTILEYYLYPVEVFWSSLPPDYHLHTSVAIGFLSLTCFLLSMLCSKSFQTLARKDRRVLTGKHDHINSIVKPRSRELYNEYLSQCLTDEDLTV